MDAGNAAWRLTRKEHELLDAMLEEMEAAEEAGGEAPKPLQDELQRRMLQAADARDQVADAMLEIRRKLEACRAEKKRLDARIGKLAKLYDRVEQQVFDTMEQVGLKRMDGDTHSITAVRRKDSKVVLVDEGAIVREFGERFTRPPEPPEPQIDKEKVEKALKDGEDVPGARLEDSTFLKLG